MRTTLLRLLDLCLAVFLASCPLLVAPAAGQRLNFRGYTNQDALPQRQVLAIYQQPPGYLWFGTYSGLSRYDGAEFETYDARHGLSSHTVLDLAEDAEGRLVAATQDGGICTLEVDRFRCLNDSKLLLDDSVHDLHLDPDGTLWAATEGGVSHLLGERSDHFTRTEGLPSDDSYRIARGPQGRLWVGTDRGLARLDGGRFVEVAPEELGERTIRVLQAWGDGLVIGTSSGAFLLRDDQLSPMPTGGNDECSDAAVGPDGALWLSTLNGVLRFKDGLAERLTTRNGLIDNSVHRVLIDREGSVWFGSDGGAAKLVPGPFLGYTDAEGLPHPFVRALGEDHDGRLWAGTRAGIGIFDGNGFSTLSNQDGLENDRIYGFAKDPDGGMWIATRDGLALWKGKVVRTLHSKDGLPSDYVSSLLEDGSGGLWVGTSRGLVHWNGTRLEPVDDPVASSTHILTMTLDLDRRLWLGLRGGGILVLDGERSRAIDAGRGLTDEVIWSLDLDDDGTVWAGSNGHGVFAIDGDSIRQWTTDNGLVNDFVWQVLHDPDSGIWIYTNRGLDRYDGERFFHYGAGDGLLDLEGSATAAWRSSNGELWFGSGRGLSRYRPALTSASPIPPPIVIAEVVASKTGPVRANATLRFRPQEWIFRFASPSFRNEAALRFQYRLLGADGVWSSPIEERFIRYGQLGPGRYELQVRASNRDGVWSAEPASFSFAVLPRWWQTLWARAGLLTAAAGLVAVVFAWRLRRIEDERNRLSRLVAQHTAELEEKNALLREISITDDLTGLYNRRHFMHCLQLELQKMSRGSFDTGIGLLLIDIDHFKRVNDDFGHSVGDRFLGAVAQRIGETCSRAPNLVARYGGEEFAVLVHSDVSGAEIVANRILTSISGRRFELEGLKLRLTVSIGISHLRRLALFNDDVARELIDRADAALYRAKDRGRNRIEGTESLVRSEAAPS